jgi:hypothetical protein
VMRCSALAAVAGGGWRSAAWPAAALAIGG